MVGFSAISMYGVIIVGKSTSNVFLQRHNSEIMYSFIYFTLTLPLFLMNSMMMNNKSIIYLKKSSLVTHNKVITNMSIVHLYTQKQ